MLSKSDLHLEWVGLKTIARKEMVRIFRIWPQTLLPPAVTNTLYFLIFGGFIGSQVNDVQGVGYMNFIVPGLIMMSVVTTSYMNVVSTFFSAKFMRNIDELLVSPLSNMSILLGYVSGGIVRSVLVALIVTGISMFFTKITLTHPWLILFTTLMTSLLFCLAGFINAVFAKKFDDISIVPTFVLTPLTYLGGVFYSIDQLPQFWRTLSLFNPILYLVNVFRYGFLGVSDIPVWNSVWVLCFFLIALFILAFWLLKRGIGLRS